MYFSSHLGKTELYRPSALRYVGFTTNIKLCARTEYKSCWCVIFQCMISKFVDDAVVDIWFFMTHANFFLQRSVVLYNSSSWQRYRTRFRSLDRMSQILNCESFFCIFLDHQLKSQVISLQVSIPMTRGYRWSSLTTCSAN